jgi:hypothetical protein
MLNQIFARMASGRPSRLPFKAVGCNSRQIFQEILYPVVVASVPGRRVIGSIDVHSIEDVSAGRYAHSFAGFPSQPFTHYAPIDFVLNSAYAKLEIPVVYENVNPVNVRLSGHRQP